jgi:hypothetical protein
MLLASYRDRSVDLPLDRQAYDALLEELKQKAAAGRLKKRQTGKKDEVLPVLPEGT